MVGATLGILCSKRLGDLLLRGESLTTSNFYLHWYIHNETVGVIDWPSTKLEPVILPPQIRKNDSSKGILSRII